MRAIICNVLVLYALAIVARIVLDYIQVPSDHVVGQIRNLLARISDPILGLIRSVIPDVPVGPVRLDLSPMVLLLAIFLLQRVIC